MSDSLGILVVVLALAVAVLIYSCAKLTKKSWTQRATIAGLESQVKVIGGEIHDLAHEEFRRWVDKELESLRLQQKEIAEREALLSLEQWKFENETVIRSDAIQRSQSVIIGKVTEHLLPYMPHFSYNPKDVRFVGSPIDLVIFDGLDEDDVREIVFVEVKTGHSAALTRRERQIRDAVCAGRVKWLELRINREQ